MGNDLPQFKDRTVTMWLCLDANAKCGLWYADEAQAMAQRGHWTAIFPVDIPAAVYAGFPVPGSTPATRSNQGRVETAGARRAMSEVREAHPAPRNAAAADPDGQGQARPPSESPDGPEVEEIGDQGAGGDDDVTDAGDVQAVLADLGVDGVVCQENGEDE